MTVVLEVIFRKTFVSSHSRIRKATEELFFAPQLYDALAFI